MSAEERLRILISQRDALYADLLELEWTGQLTDRAAAVLFAWLRAMQKEDWESVEIR